MPNTGKKNPPTEKPGNPNRPDFRNLDTHALSLLLASPGSEMKFDTGMLIYSLKDTQLYTVSQAVSSKYGEKHPLYDAMCSRLSSFAHNLGMAKRRDARLGNASAWYGKTFKEALNNKTWYRAQLHQGLLDSLSIIINKKEEEAFHILLLQEELKEARDLARKARENLKALQCHGEEYLALEDEARNWAQLAASIFEELRSKSGGAKVPSPLNSPTNSPFTISPAKGPCTKRPL